MPTYHSASGSAAEDLFIELFSETFGAEKAGYLYSQYHFYDIYQNSRYADFVLENGARRVAIEIDDETSHNKSLVASNKFYDDLLKQNSMVYLGWDVYRWAVRQMQIQPEAVKDELRVFLGSHPQFKEIEDYLPQQRGKALDGSNLELKKHQIEALKSLQAMRDNSETIALLYHATGTGKTVTAVMDAKSRGGRTLFLAHTQELVNQATETFRKLWPSVTVGRYMESIKQPNAHVVCGSVQSVALHLDSFKDNDFDYLIVDEAHHAAADTYQKVLSYLNPSKQPQTRPRPETVIYPFGLNQSQKIAVENALSSQVSIIQGPPGTGKTQTILNIIANAVRVGKTVAVVSNNNSATLNVAEKLEKKGLSFLTAFLGSLDNKNRFLENQTGRYPNMESWSMEQEEKERLNQEVTALSKELSDMLNAKNRIAEIEQEFLQLKPEQYYFDEHYATYAQAPQDELRGLSSQKILSLWLEYEQHAETESKLGLLKKLSIMFRFNRSALKIFLRAPELVIPYLQRQFYTIRQKELSEEKARLEQQLEHYAFEEKMEELTEKSLLLFRTELSATRPWRNRRQVFEMRDFRSLSAEFNREYPVVLSTTYSIKGTLNIDHIYDYLIVDEASQVDLATGVLALACARNIVIVGDLQQLPNVLDGENTRSSEAIWSRYSLPETYHFSVHSLLSSALATWSEAPTVLLREHYRCHPKIINFCNQKFYDGKLIVMTSDHNEPDVLTMYRTAPGNHARGHLNQRQIDVIREEVLPRLTDKGYQSIGIITPYRDQVSAIQSQLGKGFEVATVHKFQGREKDAIILTSVDNVITEFVDDPRMLNVAVSRAVKSLTVVTSQDPRNGQTNYGDLARYIEYNNCAVVESSVYSVFDLLYQGYAHQRRLFLQKHRQVSVYDSENLLYAVIETVLQKPEFSTVSCAVHVSLVNLIKDYSLLDADETTYARNPLTHIDFLLFRKMDKSPLLAIEVDGTAFHAVGSAQAERDQKKNHIFEKCGIPLLRLRTDGSGEREKIAAALQSAQQKRADSEEAHI